jgi:hypothetical protein
MFYRKELDHVEADSLVQSRRLSESIMRWVLVVLLLGCMGKAWMGPTPNERAILEKLDEGERLTLGSWLDSEKVDEPRLKARDHAVIGWWWAAVAGAVVSAVLLVALPLWFPAGQKEGDAVHDVPMADEENAGDSGFSRLVSGRPLFFLALGLAVIVGGWIRAPRLGHSFWNDEEYAVRKHIHGDYKTQEDGSRTFREVPWVEVLAENGNGNNHVLHSVLARVSLRVWQVFTHKAPEVFSEVGVRLPSYLAGLCAIWLIGLVGWEFGNKWVGLTAAWLLCLHPWHIRYAVEARGYSLMLFFLLLALYGLIRAQREHGMGSWLMFAAGVAGMLTSYAGAIYVVIALNGLALMEMALRGQPRRVGALVAMNALAAIPVLFLMLPSVPQLLGFMTHQERMQLPANGEWLRDLGAHVMAGVQYANTMTSDHAGTSWLAMSASAPQMMGALAWLLGLLVVLGLISAFFESAASRFSVLALLVAGALGFWHASQGKNPNLSWYYVYLMVPMCLALGLAVARMQVAPMVLMAVVVGCYGYATDVPREVMRTVDRQPIRQTVEAIKKFRPAAVTGVFGVSDKQAESYDPNVQILEEPEDVQKLLQQGEQAGQEVFVYVAGSKESSVRKPEVFKSVVGSPNFELWKTLKGTEAMFSYEIYRCVPLKK